MPGAFARDPPAGGTLQMSRVLITGVAGFIGSSLAHECIARGYDVRGVDNLSAGSLDNISDIEEIEFYKGSLSDRRLLRNLCADIEIVFHQAALPSITRSIADPLSCHVANLDGTLNLLLEAQRQGVRRVVYASSSAAYGNSSTLPNSEWVLPVPITPYAIQKLASEHYMRCFARLYGMETVSLRHFNVFGPRQSAHSAYSGVLVRFITAMLSDITPEIYGDGSQTRDFAYIDDVVEATLLAATKSPDAVSGRVFNIASGESRTLLDTYKLVAELLHFDRQPKFLPSRNGDVLHSQADISLAHEYLGYAPRINFRDGLQRTIDWYRDGRRRPAELFASAG
jgi:UDP-glucose 4-epimerase